MRFALNSRRHVAALVLLFVMIVPVLVACGGPGTGGGQTTTAPSGGGTGTQATAAPSGGGTGGQATTAPAGPEATSAPAGGQTGGNAPSGGTLHILYWQAPTVLNPHQAGGTKDYDASSVTLEPLAHWSPDGKPVAALAAEIPTVENGGTSKDLKTTTWKLKPGLKWSDGSPFSADDVVFTYQYCVDKETACTNISNYDVIEKVEAVDPNTVKITWKEPNPNFYISFVGFGGMILQKKQFEQCKGPKANECAENNKPVGTGPYRVKDFKPGDVVVYEKNPNYRDADKVAFDTVELKGGGDPASAARAAFQTGETDYAWNMQVEKSVLEQIMQGGKAELINPVGPDVERVLINFANPDPALGDKRSEPDQPHPFFSDIKVRQAFALAVDKKTMAEQLYGVTGKPTCNIVAAPPDLVSPNTKCDQDIEQAKKLLDEAGWKDDGSGVRKKDGKPLAITFATTINPLRQKEQALLKADWAKIGVQTELKQVDGGVFFSSDAGNPDAYGHFYWDVMMYTNGSDNPDPTVYLSGWACDQVSAKANNWNLANNARYCDKAYDAMLAQLKKESDPAKRKDLIIKMNDKLVNDFVIIPLINRTSVPGGKAKNLTGPTGNPWDSSLWNIAEWRKTS